MTENDMLQYAVVGDFVMSPACVEDVRGVVNKHGLEGRHFSNPALRAAFEAAMAFDGDNKVNLQCEIATHLSSNERNIALDSSANTLHDCDEHVKRLINDYVMRSVSTIPLEANNELKGKTNDPQTYIDLCHRKLDALLPTRTKSKGTISAKEFIDSFSPEEEEKKRLFKGDQGRWLAKEGALVLVSTAGAGKSVLVTQMSLLWACGKPFLGIEPARPLKIGIFQTEDDNETMRQNILDCKKAGKWSQDDFDLAASNFFLNDTQGRMGDDFISLMADTQKREMFDLIVINPLQGICAGTDISKNQELTRFLRDGLDSVIKGRRRGCPPCGLVLVHHTNKPVASQNGYGIASPQFLEYAAAGGGQLMYWHEVDATTAAPTAAAKANTVEEDAAALAKAIAASPRPPTLTEARDFAHDFFGKPYRGKAAFSKISKDFAAFGLEVKKGDKPSQRLICPLSKV